jgi:hypothetical protein
VAGLNEEEIQKAWTAGKRQPAIALALATQRDRHPVMGPAK